MEVGGTWRGGPLRQGKEREGREQVAACRVIITARGSAAHPHVDHAKARGLPGLAVLEKEEAAGRCQEARHPHGEDVDLAGTRRPRCYGEEGDTQPGTVEPRDP